MLKECAKPHCAPQVQALDEPGSYNSLRASLLLAKVRKQQGQYEQAVQILDQALAFGKEELVRRAHPTLSMAISMLLHVSTTADLAGVLTI